MDKTDLIISTLDGENDERVPTFCPLLEDRTFNEVLGQPVIKPRTIMGNPFSRFIENTWPGFANRLVKPFIENNLEKRIKAAVELDFDTTWMVYENTFIIKNSKELIRYSGSLLEMRDDGLGNIGYYYKEPLMKNEADFENWKYWVDPEKLAKDTFKFYKKMVDKYGDKICIMGQGPVFGFLETIYWSIGFANLAKWTRKRPDLIEEFCEKLEDYTTRCITSMMDAGIKVIVLGDDMGYKQGPILQPRLVEKFFGATYKRLIQMIHERDCKAVLHSCGDNTGLFEHFVDWGFDGAHALEDTSNLNFENTKTLFGDKLTFFGGVGMELFTERASDQELKNGVLDLLRVMAPGGRFVAGPVHTESSIQAEKLQKFLEIMEEYGTYSQIQKLISF